MIKRKNFFAEKATYGNLVVSTMSVWGILGLLDKSKTGLILFFISLLGVIVAMLISKKLQKIDIAHFKNVLNLLGHFRSSGAQIDLNPVFKISVAVPAFRPYSLDPIPIVQEQFHGHLFLEIPVPIGIKLVRSQRTVLAHPLYGADNGGLAVVALAVQSIYSSAKIY